jgi:hypothetical protein
MTPADKEAVIHTMVATTIPPTLIGADGKIPRVVLISDGQVESTRLLIDGVDVGDLADVDFSSWSGSDEVWLQWSTAQKDIGGVMQNSRYTLIANEIKGDTGMNKMKEYFENLPATISEAITAAMKADPDKEVDVSALVSEAVAEKAKEFDDYISPEELEAKATEIADQKIKERDELAQKIAERTLKATEAGVVMNDDRLAEIAALEDDKFDEWIQTQLASYDEMVASLEEKHGITLGGDSLEELKSFTGVNSPEYKGYASAFASVLSKETPAGSPEGGDDDDDDKPTGW